ncbi:hypothetical protein GCM10009810_03550 [Nostocoides vanveenii]|uniref:Uncharacterized protein n=2 Tax=Nostocoides vanveenii TaxID=330835 RepID=A0ABP4W3S9_9MICO
MVEMYRRAMSEAGYNATYFLQMLAADGPLVTARRLVMSSKPSDGFTALWERKRLGLTVEAHILQERFADLFTDEERSVARRRLDEYGYRPPLANEV